MSYTPGIPAPADYRFVALDVETANYDPASICQVGFAAVDHAGTVHRFGTYIDPECTFDAMNVSIHGITASTVKGAPKFGEIAPALWAILAAQPTVQHGTFDRGAVRGAAARNGQAEPAAHWIDSVWVARRAWPEWLGNGGHGLAHLTKKLGITFTHHDGIDDARAAAEIILLAERHTGRTLLELAQPKPKGSWSARVSAEGAVDGPLFGHTAVFTGALSISRNEAARIASEAGITVAPGVTKKITILVVGDQDLSALAGHSKSSKHRKAEEMVAQGADISIIGESEFLAMIEGK